MNRISFWPILIAIVALLACAQDHKNITPVLETPQTAKRDSVLNRGIARLKQITEITLSKNRVTLGQVQEIAIVDDHFLVRDALTNKIHWYNSEGNWQGEWGKGQASITEPYLILTGFNDLVHVYDRSSLKTSIFNRKGKLLGLLHPKRELPIERLALDTQGNTFSLHVTGKRVPQLTKVDRLTDRVLFRSNLESPKLGQVVSIFGKLTCFEHSSKLGTIYYAAPTEFLIKEIDTQSGHVNRIFGIQPSDYHPLSPSFLSGSLSSPEEASKLLKETTIIWDSALLADRFLIIAFGLAGKPGWQLKAEWIVYDVSKEPIQMYHLASPEMQVLLPMVANRSRLYVYEFPDDENSDNGKIRMFELEISSS